MTTENHSSSFFQRQEHSIQEIINQQLLLQEQLRPLADGGEEEMSSQKWPKIGSYWIIFFWYLGHEVHVKQNNLIEFAIISFRSGNSPNMTQLFQEIG